jgi:hypothetical protein
MPRPTWISAKGLTILATPPRLLEMHLAELAVSSCRSVSTLTAVREYLAQAPTQTVVVDVAQISLLARLYALVAAGAVNDT